MTKRVDGNLLAELLTEIERGWFDERDGTVVDRLSNQHPELRDDLCEFFEDLVLGPGPATDSDDVEAEEHVHNWLQSNGFEIAIKSAAAARRTPAISKKSPSTERASRESGMEPAKGNKQSQTTAQRETWIAFLRRRLGRTLSEIAGSIPDVTSEYLVLIGRYPQVVPSTVKTEIAARIERCWGVSQEETLSHLVDPVAFSLAATRSVPFEKEPSTFQDLLSRSALSKQQKTFWLKYADRPN